jgi:hypothetical protein
MYYAGWKVADSWGRSVQDAIVAIVAIVAVPVRRYRTAGPSPVQLVSLLKGGTSGVSEL